ncbi:MAG: hypothetical protein ACRCV5_16520 [Afipia sp.]
MSSYTIARVTPAMLACDNELWAFCTMVARKSTENYPQLDSSNFDIVAYAATHRMMVCWYKGEPVGIMMAHLQYSILDPKVVIYYQDVLWARPGTRAAYYLMQDFIDFGKKNANHLITMIAAKTNLNARSLERLGFKELETLYRMEVP